jgi:fumarate hydratase class II
MGRSTKPTRSSSTHVETGALDRCRDRVILRAARNMIDGKLGEHLASVVLGEELGSKKPVHHNHHVDIS